MEKLIGTPVDDSAAVPKDVRTSLPDGRLVRKDDLRMEACGTIDELNSFIGLLAAETSAGEVQELRHIQRVLFYVGGVVVDAQMKSSLSLADELVKLQNSIRGIEDSCGKFNSFVLPGGCRSAALSHVCRSVCRRAERSAVALGKYEVVPYLNRLSTYFFYFAKKLNYFHNVDEIKL